MGVAFWGPAGRESLPGPPQSWQFGKGFCVAVRTNRGLCFLLLFLIKLPTELFFSPKS